MTPHRLPLHWQSERLVLREMTSADITAQHVAWLNDPLVVAFSNQRFVLHTPDSCRRYLAGFADSPNWYLSARLRSTDQAIGTLTAYCSRHHGTADIGILMGERSLWGQGLGAEAFGLLASWLDSRPGMRKLTCGMLACNHGMVAVARRAGFVLDGVRARQELVDGVPTDILYFARFC